MRIIKLLSPLILLFYVLLSGSSCSIERYSNIKIKTDSLEFRLNRIPTGTLKSYDSSLYAAWMKTANSSIQTKTNIQNELDKRKTRETSLRKILAATTGVSTLSITIYTLAAVNPSTTWIGILGFISGGSFATTLGWINDDPRITELSERIKQLDLFRQDAEAQLSILEKLITEYSVLKMSGKADLMSFPIVAGTPTPDKEILDKVNEIETQILKFRDSIGKWDQACR